MPKATKSGARESQFLPSSTLIIDNGGYSIKAGFAPSWPSLDTDTLKRSHTIPNSLARTRDRRTYVASQQDNISQWSEATFRRPVERGQLVNWEAEKEIWDHSFFDEMTAHKDVFVKEPENTTLVLTEAPNTMQALQRNADEIIMEEWGFGGYARVVGGYGQRALSGGRALADQEMQDHHLTLPTTCNLFSVEMAQSRVQKIYYHLRNAFWSSTAAIHTQPSRPCTTAHPYKGQSAA